MIDPFEQAMEEVRTWKRLASEKTEGMLPAQIIAFYRQAAEALQQQYGLHLPRRPASEMPNTQQSR